MRPLAAAGIGLSTLVCAACANGVAQPQSSASGTPSTAAGPVAACVVGDWTTTQVGVTASSPAGEASLSGGGGVVVRIASDGKVNIDFTTMDPAKFSATNGEAALSGQFRYGGQVTGQVRTGDATSTSGTWEPVGKTDFSAVRITVDLTEPIPIRPFDNAPLSSVIGGDKQIGDAVEVDPLLARSNYSCGPGTLTLTRSDGTGMTWQMNRKS